MMVNSHFPSTVAELALSHYTHLPIEECRKELSIIGERIIHHTHILVSDRSIAVLNEHVSLFHTEDISMCVYHHERYFVVRVDFMPGVEETVIARRPTDRLGTYGEKRRFISSLYSRVILNILHQTREPYQELAEIHDILENRTFLYLVGKRIPDADIHYILGELPRTFTDEQLMMIRLAL